MLQESVAEASVCARGVPADESARATPSTMRTATCTASGPGGDAGAPVSRRSYSIDGRTVRANESVELLLRVTRTLAVSRSNRSRFVLFESGLIVLGFAIAAQVSPPDVYSQLLSTGVILLVTIPLSYWLAYGRG